MVLQEKVHVLFGTAGSNNMKVIMEVGNKYKTIVHNFAALSTISWMQHSSTATPSSPPMTPGRSGAGIAYYFGQNPEEGKEVLYHLPGLTPSATAWQRDSSRGSRSTIPRPSSWERITTNCS
jgi:hypothetical protein